MRKFSFLPQLILSSISKMRKKSTLPLLPVFVLTLVGAFLISACSSPEQKPTAKTVVGIFTPYFFFPEALHGKVKTMKEVNYWANDDNGTITAGDRISVAARDSFQWTNDLEVHFDENGTIEKTVFLNEDDLPFGHWDALIVDGKLTGANWVVHDTTKSYVQISYSENGMSETRRFNSEPDTLLNRAEIKTNAKGQKESLQFYNSANKPGALFKFNYNMDGSLENYTVSRNDTIRGGMNFQYNDEGFTQSQEVYSYADSNRESYVYNYTYDDMGNWTSYTSYKDGKPVVVCKRNYTYYPE